MKWTVLQNFPFVSVPPLCVRRNLMQILIEILACGIATKRTLHRYGWHALGPCSKSRKTRRLHLHLPNLQNPYSRWYFVNNWSLDQFRHASRTTIRQRSRSLGATCNSTYVLARFLSAFPSMYIFIQQINLFS